MGHGTTRWLPLLSCLLALPPGAKASSGDRTPLADGDLVFQQSLSDQSEAIALATRSTWTHMGVVRLRGATPWVFEAGARVRLVRLDAWAASGKDGRVVVKRLREADKLLTPAVKARMAAIGRRWMGRRYDLLFQWSDDKLYCSELVHKLYREGANLTIGQPQPAGSFALDHPVVRRKLEQRFGARFDPKEPIISPQAMFEDAQLVTIHDGRW